MIGLYFSGTGNTKYCIEQYVKEMGYENSCYSIESKEWISLIKKESVIVLAYPIYYSNLPKIMKDFIVQHHSLWNQKQIFILTTMGLFSGDGAGCGARLLKQYGAEIIGGLHLKMPDCISDEKILKKSLKNNQALISKTMIKLQKAAIAHKNGKPVQEGLSMLSHILGLFGQRLWFSHKTSHYTDHLVVHTDQCIGCGLCEELCPMNNIHIVGNKAVASDHCTMCYRCINHCPAKAITLLGTQIYEQSLIEHYVKKKI